MTLTEKNQKVLEKNKNERIGEKYISNQGYEFEIIDYNNYKNCTIKFEDGVILYNCDYKCIKEGSIKHPNCPIGITKNELNAVITTKMGWDTNIIKWNNKNDIDIMFLYDKCISKNKSHQSFKAGTTMHPIHGRIKFDDFLNIMNEVVAYPNGHTSKIKEYRNASDVSIIFDDGAIVEHTSYHNFHNGKTMHPIEKRCQNNKYERVINFVWKMYQDGAKSRGYSFNLTKENIKEIIFQPCFYCGFKGSNNHHKIKHLKIKYNGLDRINSKIGYEIGNIVPCCTFCNITKNDLEFDDWIEYLERISKYNINNRDDILKKINIIKQIK